MSVCPPWPTVSWPPPPPAPPPPLPDSGWERIVRPPCPPSSPSSSWRTPAPSARPRQRDVPSDGEAPTCHLWSGPGRVSPQREVRPRGIVCRSPRPLSSSGRQRRPGAGRGSLRCGGVRRCRLLRRGGRPGRTCLGARPPLWVSFWRRRRRRRGGGRLCRGRSSRRRGRPGGRPARRRGIIWGRQREFRSRGRARRPPPPPPSRRDRSRASRRC
mmetsp:Transcript_31685/g.72690  ORF Transcript_31685/g.72690 Transcript_31685/m.72690 type:complete len:214 (-) Transcript_31685:241-882(-)